MSVLLALFRLRFFRMLCGMLLFWSLPLLGMCLRMLRGGLALARFLFLSMLRLGLFLAELAFGVLRRLLSFLCLRLRVLLCRLGLLVFGFFRMTLFIGMLLGIERGCDSKD